MSHGTGQKDARAAKRKYYLEEEVRNERLTEGGDFVLRGRSVPLHLSVPQARNFGIMFRCLFYSNDFPEMKRKNKFPLSISEINVASINPNRQSLFK